MFFPGVPVKLEPGEVVLRMRILEVPKDQDLTIDGSTWMRAEVQEELVGKARQSAISISGNVWTSCTAYPRLGEVGIAVGSFRTDEKGSEIFVPRWASRSTMSRLRYRR